MTGNEFVGLADFLHEAVLRWIGKTGELSRRESPRWDNTYDDGLLERLNAVETTLRSWSGEAEQRRPH